MATSEVEICNMALSLIRQDPITSIEIPTTEPERKCALWYHQSRKKVLESNPWKFAARRTSIARDPIAPLYGYTDRYKLPIDFVRMISIGQQDYQSYYEDQCGKWVIENGYILVNSSFLGEEGTQLYINYVYDFQDITKFSALFVESFTTELSSKIAFDITGSAESTKRVTDMNSSIAPIAKAVHGQNNPVKRKERSKWINARRQGSYSDKSRYNF